MSPLRNSFSALVLLLISSPAVLAYSEYELGEAINNRSLPKVKEILKKDPSLAAKKSDGWKEGDTTTAMSAAADVGWLPGGELLMQYNASVQAGDPPPLTRAAGSGSVPFVDFLLKHKADVNVVDRHGNTALREALWFNRKDVAALLIKNGAKTDLFTDSALGRIQSVTDALKRKPSLINKVDRQGESLMHWAAVSNSLAMANALLLLQANINARDTQFDTPLQVAITRRSNAMMRWLIDKGANFNDSDAEAAAKEGHPSSWAGKEAALESAVRANNLEAATLLLKKGANPNRKGLDGGTPLHLTAILGSVEMAKLLLAHGANVGAVTDRHDSRVNDSLDPSPQLYTALHWAVMEGKLPMVTLLVASKSNVNALTSKRDGHRTPLAIAKDQGFKDIAEFLRQHGGKL
ncbi:hypothetical protein BH10CYA1_BH10CYA1_56480 [soil metagenome]